MGEDSKAFDYFRADLDRAMAHERKFGGSRRAANDVVDAANMLTEKIRQGRLGFVEADIRRLEQCVAILKRHLETTRSNPDA